MTSVLRGGPSRDELERLYYELGRRGGKCVGERRPWQVRIAALEDLIAFAAHSARYDPRLFHVMALYFIAHWREVNPLALRERYAQLQTPQIFAVIGEFVAHAVADLECRYFFEYLSAGLEAVPAQLFFIDVFPPGSEAVLREAGESLAEFRKWGFLSRERPIVDSETRQTSGTWSASARKQILKRLLQKKNRISTGDYLHAVQHSISRQQAIVDLRHAAFLKPCGKGRGSYWTLTAVL